MNFVRTVLVSGLAAYHFFQATDPTWINPAANYSMGAILVFVLWLNSQERRELTKAMNIHSRAISRMATALALHGIKIEHEEEASDS